MDTMKNYQPEPVPVRKRADLTYTQIKNSAEEIEKQPRCEIQFAEVALGNRDSGSRVTAPSSQSIRPASDEKRALFYEMRKIARLDMSYIGNPSKIFYFQARMMEDFTDDFASQIPFSFYYPYYQLMGYGQLRTYFTWRTRVRAGDIQPTSLSYVFVYIYELLACIGEQNPSASLKQLKNLWKTYRRFDNTIDKYMLLWIRDFYIYYPVKQSFLEFATEQNLQKHYSKVFLYSSDRENSFALYAQLSKYNIRKSIFFTDQTKELISDCFYFLLCRMRKLCKASGKLFEDFVFCPAQEETEWKPFAGALFYPYLDQEDRTVIFSEREVYTCIQNKWTYCAGVLTDSGIDLIGYIMKEMESVLRKQLHFRYKINADPGQCDSSVLKKLEAVGIIFPGFISQGVKDFFAVRNRKPVHVDRESVRRIRSQSLETQEKLIVPENEEVCSSPVEPAQLDPPAPVSDVWAAFTSALTDTEMGALRAILCEKDVKAFARANGVMLEVLLDGINEKAMDTIGDTLLEIDETVTVYDEYRDKLMESAVQ